MESKKPRLIVIGAGFAGLKVVQGLKSAPLDIVLIDRHNYHLFQPLLYQVATAALSPADIAYPIRRIFRSQKNVMVGMGDVEVVDLSNKVVGSGDARLSFDYLVIAVGATHSYFGKDAWNVAAPGLKTIDDALHIRKRVLLAFEEAEYEGDEASRRADLTFVVIGGGPTGVEMAGALREIAANDIPRDFRHIDTTTARIILLQGGDRLLPAFHADLGARAKSDLEAMGVEVRLNSKVTDVDEGGVWIGQEYLSAQNVLWAAGVQAPALLKSMDVPKNRAGAVLVNPDLSVPGYPQVFVVGDSASITDPKTSLPVPGVAPAAMQMGKFVAKIIAAELAGKLKIEDRPTFEYFDKGTMATIGKRRAVADIRGWKFTGIVAWLMWSVIHLTFLISFRTKLFVMLGWVYDYVLSSREARLITGKAILKIRRPRTLDKLSAMTSEAKV